MSYPWGNYDNSIIQLVSQNYLAARSTNPGYNMFSSLDRYALKMQNFDKRVSAQTANSWIDYSIKERAWLIEMVHGINRDGYSPVDSSEFMKHLDYINENKNEVWCSTVSDVIKYMDESKKAEIKCDECNDTVYKIRLNDFMDDSVFNQKLSVRIKVPSNWENIKITASENFRIENNNNNKFVLFNALPDNKEIIIKPKTISIPVKETGIRMVYLSENPFSDHIRLSFEVLGTNDIEVLLCDSSGRVIVVQKEKSITGIINYNFETSQLQAALPI
jgi:hypothetical protein